MPISLRRATFVLLAVGVVWLAGLAVHADASPAGIEPANVDATLQPGEDLVVEKTVWPEFAQTDFSSVAALTLNGSAAQAGTALRLTPNAGSQAGSAFLTTAVALPASGAFHTAFTFQITDSAGVPDSDGPGADGVTFVLQPNAPTALGGVGGAIGYGGAALANSVAVEFDTWNNGAGAGDPDGNHVGIDVNGSVNSVATAPVAPRLNDGAVWHAWIDYDGTTLEVRLATSPMRPVAPNLSHVVDLPAVLGGTSAFAGFTAATGGAVGTHDILSWSRPVSVALESDCVGATGGAIVTSFAPPTRVVFGTAAHFQETISVADDAAVGDYSCTDTVVVNGHSLIAYSVEQDGVTTPITPISSGGTVSAFYGYGTLAAPSNASANTGLEVAEASILYLHRGSDGISLVLTHDKGTPGGSASGGSASLTFTGVPVGTSFVVEDDPAEVSDPALPGAFTQSWGWNEWNTDGGALQGSLNGTFAIRIDPDFTSGISAWHALSEGGSVAEAFSLDEPVTVRAALVTEAKRIHVGTGGGAAPCSEAVNPGGKRVPMAPGHGGQGQNQDGFFEVGAAGPQTTFFVRDAGTGTVFGPFDPGTRIKYTEAPGATPAIKAMGGNNARGGHANGAQAVAWHIIGQGDAEVLLANAPGATPVAACLVPPPPK